MHEWIQVQQGFLWWLALLSFATFLIGLIVTPLLVIRMPADFFTRERRQKQAYGSPPPPMQITLKTQGGMAFNPWRHVMRRHGLPYLNAFCARCAGLTAGSQPAQFGCLIRLGRVELAGQRVQRVGRLGAIGGLVVINLWRSHYCRDRFRVGQLGAPDQGGAEQTNCLTQVVKIDLDRACMRHGKRGCCHVVLLSKKLLVQCSIWTKSYISNLSFQ
jgi:hypothetical protein